MHLQEIAGGVQFHDLWMNLDSFNNAEEGWGYIIHQNAMCQPALWHRPSIKQSKLLNPEVLQDQLNQHAPRGSGRKVLLAFEFLRTRPDMAPPRDVEVAHPVHGNTAKPTFQNLLVSR